MMEKEHSLKTLLFNIGGICILTVENIVLAISYIFMASYYILLTIELIG